MAQEAGADYLGVVVEFPPSPRSLPVMEAQSVFSTSTIRPVAVTVNLTLDQLGSIAENLSLMALQLHGDETPEQVRELRERVACQIWKTLHLPPKSDETHCEGEALKDLLAQAEEYVEAGVNSLVLDALVKTGNKVSYGGTGCQVDWDLASRFAAERHVILAGGLTPDNVREAVRSVQPFAVDVSSGVESSPGIKDHDMIRRFISEARAGQSSHALTEKETLL
ncbi:MAG: phosphoribosylanthranilate isomerase [Armatimonadetes bacterium]|nr:phosphoribosylanthranilate isomerase [Armatimonadota bacterium]